MPLNILPTEIIIIITGYLGINDLHSFAFTCKKNLDIAIKAASNKATKFSNIMMAIIPGSDHGLDTYRICRKIIAFNGLYQKLLCNRFYLHINSDYNQFCDSIENAIESLSRKRKRSNSIQSPIHTYKTVICDASPDETQTIEIAKFEFLPYEILTIIFSYLNTCDINQLALTNSYFLCDLLQYSKSCIDEYHYMFMREIPDLISSVFNDYPGTFHKLCVLYLGLYSSYYDYLYQTTANKKRRNSS